MHWTERYLGGHISFTLGTWRFVIYGFNAMHIAINVRTKKWGYICFHPSVKCFGRWWPWYLYFSPNATPWAASFAIGPGLYNSDRCQARVYYELFGHNFDTDKHYDQMQMIKDTLANVRWQISKARHISLYGEL